MLKKNAGILYCTMPQFVGKEIKRLLRSILNINKDNDIQMCSKT